MFFKIFFLSSVHTAMAPPGPPSSCNNPEIALYNNQTYTGNGVEFVIGTVGQCEDGILFGYCDVGNIADGAARYFCNAVGYLGKLVCTVIIFCVFLMFEPIFLLFVSPCLSLSLLVLLFLFSTRW